MPAFKVGESHKTREAVIEVTVTADAPLRVGSHIFQLVVTDDAGNESLPARVTVVVRDTERPTAVIKGPRSVGQSESFKLSGEDSSDVAPGKIVSYIWTLVEAPQ